MRIQQRLADAKYAAPLFTLGALAIGAILIVIGYFSDLRPALAHFESLDPWDRLEEKHPPSLIGDFIWWKCLVILGLLIPAGLATIARWNSSAPTGFVFVLNGVFTLAVLGAEISANWQGAMVSQLGEEPSPMAYFVKLFLIAFSLMSPAIIFAYYRHCSTMDRYSLKNFGFPFILCLVGFIIIALLIDLQDNFADFANSEESMAAILMYYVKLFPQIIVTFTPVALLLSLLYTLSKMSRANEIISMLGTGRSVVSVLRPVFFVGLMASLVCMALNYHWAPLSARNTEAMIEDFNEGDDSDLRATSQPYHSRERLWHVGRIPYNLVTDKMRGIDVIEKDEEGRPSKAWVAKSARWWPGGDESPSMWTLYNGKVIIFDEKGHPVDEIHFDGDGTEESPERIDAMWTETPWQVIGATMRADFMSVPELGSYNRANAGTKTETELAPFRMYWHYNLALPWTCFVVVLIAAPLGIVFSRRGIWGGVATAIIIFFGILVVDNIFLSFGKSGYLSPLVAAWAPRLIFGAVGLFFLMYRARNREFPKFNPALWLRNYRAVHATNS